MIDIDELRALMNESAPGLLHPQTSEEAVTTFDRVLAAIEGPQSYLVILSWFAAAGAASLQTVRDHTLPPALARRALFSPGFGPQGSDEARTPTQIAAAQMITAAANEDFPMLFALADPFAADARGAGALLADIAHLARVMHQGVCGGGH